MTNSKNEKMEIEGKRIYLKKLDEKNATQKYCGWLNDPEINKYLETREATVEDLRRYIKDKNENPNCLFLGIFFKENKKHIGNIKLEPIDFDNKKATLGILIGEKEYWGKGIGTEAVKLLVDWTFDNLRLEEVNLGVISENKAAIKVYTKAGFHIDRIEKRSIKHKGELHDKVIMSVRRETSSA